MILSQFIYIIFDLYNLPKYFRFESINNRLGKIDNSLSIIPLIGIIALILCIIICLEIKLGNLDASSSEHHQRINKFTDEFDKHALDTRNSINQLLDDNKENVSLIKQNEHNIQKLSLDINNLINKTNKDVEQITELTINNKSVVMKELNALDNKLTYQVDSMRKLIDIRNLELTTNFNQNSNVYLGFLCAYKYFRA